MKCPVCGHQDHEETSLQSQQFTEEIRKCRVCGSTWSVSHGLTEMIKDSQENSFLEGTSEPVEGDDYNALRDRTKK
jgi:transcription elongation factor Elf1